MTGSDGCNNYTQEVQWGEDRPVFGFFDGEDAGCEFAESDEPARLFASALVRATNVDFDAGRLVLTGPGSELTFGRR